jgi:hypothetical protein
MKMKKVRIWKKCQKMVKENHVRSIGAVVTCVINTKVSKVNIYCSKLIINIIVKDIKIILN